MEDSIEATGVGSNVNLWHEVHNVITEEGEPTGMSRMLDDGVNRNDEEVIKHVALGVASRHRTV